MKIEKKPKFNAKCVGRKLRLMQLQSRPLNYALLMKSIIFKMKIQKIFNFYQMIKSKTIMDYNNNNSKEARIKTAISPN